MEFSIKRQRARVERAGVQFFLQLEEAKKQRDHLTRGSNRIIEAKKKRAAEKIQARETNLV